MRRVLAEARPGLTGPAFLERCSQYLPHEAVEFGFTWPVLADRAQQCLEIWCFISGRSRQNYLSHLVDRPPEPRRWLLETGRCPPGRA
jgi:hypothetical protein